MPEEISYEFDNFRLNTARRVLLYYDELRSLTPMAFDLLRVMAANHGRTLSKTELIKSVWSETIVTDNNFNVTLNAVRRALGESGRQPRYILKVPGGYRFVADVRELPAVTSVRDVDAPKGTPGKRIPGSHVAHVLISCSIYAALYAVSVFLEVAYEFHRFAGLAWQSAPLVFVWMTISSVTALATDRTLIVKGKSVGLAASAAIFLIAAAILFLVLSRFLPSYPITKSALQSYPAQAAYLKDMSYFLVLAFCFLIVPFHFIVTMERGIERGQHQQVLGVLTGNKVSALPGMAIYPRVWALASLLVVLAAFSLVMTSRLLDHLKPGPYMNLFTQLVYLRGILYFGLGVECLIWNSRSLHELKRKCLDQVSTIP